MGVCKTRFTDTPFGTTVKESLQRTTSSKRDTLRVSVKRGPDTCGWRMRMEKNADNKKSKKEKTRNSDGKKKKLK